MSTSADEFSTPPADNANDDDTVVAVEVTEQIAFEPEPPCHVMLDLETWGTGNKAVVASIGACKFDGDNIIDAFHVGVDPVSCQAFGLDINAETILWWMDPERRDALDEWLKLERIDLASALLGFDLWCKNPPEVVAIWGNGSTFDNVIMRSAYEATGQEYPVRFWQDRCYRTMKNLTSTKMVRQGTHHNALDDAVSQAKHLQAIWRELDPSDLRSMLQQCKDQFGYYAAQHRAKLDNLDEGSALHHAATRKAEVNERFEEKIARVLNGVPPVQV